MIVVLGLSGCATMGLQQTMNPLVINQDNVMITMNVLLKRAFVRSNSMFSGEASSMFPFTDDVITLKGKIKETEEITLGDYKGTKKKS